MNGLSAAGLADLAGVTEAEVARLVELGILVARDGAGPFLAADAQKVRLATACEQAGLPMEGIAAAVRAGLLSFAFLEEAPYRRWAVRELRGVGGTAAQGVRPSGAAAESPPGLTWILELVSFSTSARSDLVAGRQKGWYGEGLARCLSDGRAAFAEHCG